MYFDDKIVSVLNIGSSVSQLLHFFSEISSTTVCGYVWVCGVSLCVCPCADMHLCEHVCLSVSLFSSTSRGFRLILYIFSTNHHFCKEPSCILLENSQCLLHCFSCVQLFVTPWTAAHQVPLSTRFFRQQYWSELPCACPGIFLIKLARLLHPKLAGGFFITSTTWEAPGE